jgi:ribonuclease R
VAEREAADAEEEAVTALKLQFLRDQIAERRPEVFEATVLEAVPGGLLVEVEQAMLRGFVRVSALAGDKYRFDPAGRKLAGSARGSGIRPGDRLEVIVARADPDRGEVEFYPA